MKSDSVNNNSVWTATAKVPSLSALAENMSADVCIVGAGIAGMTTAYLLAHIGKSVIVLDKGSVGGGYTELTTAHLSNEIDDSYVEIEKLHGAEGARLAAESHTAAIDCIEDIVNKEGIECNFERVDGYLFVPPGESLEVLDNELNAARKAGLTDVERIGCVPLDSFDTGPCLHFPRQAQFHPLRYMSGLAEAVMRDRGRVFTNTRVSK